MNKFKKDFQYYKFCAYGFLKNLRFFEAFFILFLLEKGMSYTQIGILYAAREITINLFEIPSGFAADTFGRKKSLAGSFVLYILSFVSFFLSSSFWIFLIAFIFYGIGDSFRTGTHKGMIMDYLKLNGWEDQKIAYYGHTRSWSQRGSAISSLVAGAIVFLTASYQSIFIYSIVPYLINFGLILSYPEEIDLSATEGKQNKPGIKQTFKNFIDTLKRPSVLKILNSSAAHSAYLSAIKDYIQPLMVSLVALLPILSNSPEKQKSGLVIGGLYFIIYLLNSFASVGAGKIDSRKIDIPFVTMVIGFISGIIAGIFYVNSLFALAIVSFVLIYLVENLRKPVLTGYISDNVENDILVSVISAQSQLKTIMTAVIAFVFGLFSDYFGIGYSLVITSGLLLLISIVVRLSLNNNKKKRI